MTFTTPAARTLARNLQQALLGRRPAAQVETAHAQPAMTTLEDLAAAVINARLG